MKKVVYILIGVVVIVVICVFAFRDKEVPSHIEEQFATDSTDSTEQEHTDSLFDQFDDMEFDFDEEVPTDSAIIADTLEVSV